MLTEVEETASEPISAELPAEKDTDKPKRGRPPKDTLTPWDQLKLRDWNRTLAYLYRTAPLIDRTQSGDKKYICKYSSAFDEDQVMQEYGSGGYLVRITEAVPGKNESKQVDQFNFAIMNLNYPPQIPLGQWMKDPRNEDWRWAEKLLEAKQNPQPPAQAQGNNPADIVRAAKEMAQIFQNGKPAAEPGDVIKTAVEAYTQGRKQGEENAKGGDGLGVLMPLITALVTRPEPKQDNSMLEMMKLQLEAERGQRLADREQAKADRDAAEKRAEAAEKRHSELMVAMLAKKEDSGTDVIEKFGKMFSMVNQIREGAGLGESDNSWTGLIKEGLREAMPSLAPAMVPMLGGLLNSLPLGPRPNGSMPGPVPVPRETNVPVPAPETPPEKDPHLPVYQFILANFESMKNKMGLPDGGYQWGDWIADGPGPMIIERFKAAGTERIISVFRTVPQAWEQLGPVEAKFRSFLNELMDWEPAQEDEDDDTGEPDPNVPVGAVEILKPAGKKAKAVKK